MTSDGFVDAPPRVLIVMHEQWPRALIRAALREVGYDAIGTQALTSALKIPPIAPDRGPVRLVIVDQPVLTGARDDERLAALLARHEHPATILIARPTVSVPKDHWTRVLSRPVSVEEVVGAAQEILPLALTVRRSVD